MLRALALCGIAWSLIGGSDRAQAEDILPLSFGVYTSDKPTSMYRQFKPIAVFLQERLSKSLSRPVRINLRIFRSYQGARAALAKGKVDFARLGPASFILVRKLNPAVRLLACEEVERSDVFYGVIFTRKDSPVTKIEHLRQRSFAFGDRTSTIGRYLSQALLLDHGITGDDLSFDYLGRHDRVVSAVMAGQFDAGAAKESTYRKLAKDKLRVLERFRNSTKPWVASDKLGPDVADALRSALLSLSADDEDDEEVLRAIGKKVTGFFVPPDESNYDYVRQRMEYAAKFEKTEAAQ